MVNVGKYTIHGYGMGIIKPFSPSSSAALFQSSPIDVPFLLRGLPRLFLRCGHFLRRKVVAVGEIFIQIRFKWDGMLKIVSFLTHPSNPGFSNLMQKSPHPMTPNHFARKEINHKCNTLCVSRRIVLEGDLDVQSALSSSLKKTFSHWVIRDDDQRGFKSV